MGGPDLVTRLREACVDASDDIVAVYLFGSAARGAAGRTSDLDIGVLATERHRSPSPGALDELIRRLERAARKSVDLVVLDSAPPDLVHRVLRDGMLLLDRDRARRTRFEVQARSEYFDLDAVRRRYRLGALRAKSAT